MLLTAVYGLVGDTKAPMGKGTTGEGLQEMFIGARVVKSWAWPSWKRQSLRELAISQALSSAGSGRSISSMEIGKSSTMSLSVV